MSRRIRCRRMGSPAGLSDRALLGAVGAGSRAALQELFDRHGAAVHQLAGLVANDDGEADRVVEEVFVALARRSGRLEDDVTSVRLGLLAMARRRARTDPGPAPLPLSPAASSLRALPCDARDALALTLMGSASVADVAVVLGTDRRSVAAGLRYALFAVAGRSPSPAS